MEEDSYPTLQRVLLWFEYLKKICMTKVTDTDLSKFMKLKTEVWLIKKIKIDKLHKIATILHPKFKSLKMLEEKDRLNVHSHVRKMLSG